MKVSFGGGGGGGGGALSPPLGSSGGTSNFTDCPCTAVSCVLNVLRPGALTSTAIAPESTGSAEPSFARSSSTPPRLITRPGESFEGESERVTYESFGSSAFARALATCSRVGSPLRIASCATSRYAAHALA